MLKSMSIHQRNSKGIVKSNFVTSCLTFKGSIPTSSHQPKKQTRHCKKILHQSYHLLVLSHNKVTLPLYVFLLLLVLRFFRPCHYPTVITNKILDDITKRTTHKPKDFLYCYRNNKTSHLQCTHTQKQICKSPQTEVQFPNTKEVPTHLKDSQTYNLSFSKDT